MNDKDFNAPFITVEDLSMVRIPTTRYEELIRAENTLNALCSLMKVRAPYDEDIYRAIVGEKRFPKKEDKRE